MRISEKYPALIVKGSKFKERGEYEEVRDLAAALERFRLDVVKAINSMGFVSSGDPVAPNWTTASFTKDDAYHDLDCSSIVPAGATAILFRVAFESPTVSALFRLRCNGYTNVSNQSIAEVVVSNVLHQADLVVNCDSTRMLEYLASNVTWTSLSVVIRGWWI